MIKLLFLVTFIFGSASFAAQITWNAYIAGDKAGLFAGGTGYLVKTSTTTDASVITSALQNSGIITDAATLAAKGYTAFTDSTEIGTFQYASAQSVARASNVATADDLIAGTANYFVVVLSQDQTSYAVTDVTSITIPGSGIYMWTLGYDVENKLFLEGAFNVGSVAGNVPEPTVLALLALGVAGVALRRKKVVA